MRNVTAFTGGQLLAFAVVAIGRHSFDAIAAEVSLAVAVVFLAREVLGDERRESRIAWLAAAAGLFHGLQILFGCGLDGRVELAVKTVQYVLFDGPCKKAEQDKEHERNKGIE